MRPCKSFMNRDFRISQKEPKSSFAQIEGQIKLLPDSETLFIWE